MGSIRFVASLILYYYSLILYIDGVILKTPRTLSDRGMVEPPHLARGVLITAKSFRYSTTTLIIILQRVLLFLLYRELPNCGLDMIMVKVKSQLSMQRAPYRRGGSA